MNKEELLQGVRYTDSILKSVLSGISPSKALIIDLSEEESYGVDIPQAYLEKYFGGLALGYRLWADFAGYSVDDDACMETENPVVFVPSLSLRGGIPYGNTCSFIFRSPVTKRLESASFSSDISVYPYVAVIIIGRADKSRVVEFGEDVVLFNSAENIAGLGTDEICRLYKNCITTGPAAEKKVRYSNLVYKRIPIGRAGIGLVFFLKNIKAIIFPSSEQESDVLPAVSDEGNIQGRKGKKKRKTDENDVFDKYADLRGCLYDKNTEDAILKRAMRHGWAPVDNFSKRTDPRIRYLASSDFGISRQAGDIPFEARLMLGPNVGIYDIRKIKTLYDYCLDNGLDPVSTGAVLGWIRESQKTTQNNSLRLLKNLDFKDTKSIISLLNEVIKGTIDADKKPLLNTIADGLISLSEKYGLKEKTFTISSLECGPFDYRGSYSEALNNAIGNSFYVYFAFDDNALFGNIARWVYFNERLVLGLQTLGINPMIIFSLCMRRRVITSLLLKYSVLPLRYSLPYKVLTEAVSKTIDKKVSFSTILSLGLNAKALREKINTYLAKPENKIPDYFCIEPGSAHREESVVPFHSLIDDYNTVINMVSYS